MLVFRYIHWICITALVGSATSQYQSNFNPTIIQDSRLEPKVDGTFGFQYKTEDGISHAAQGDPTGFIQGSYSYKDPTGLKVNFNYFAGARGNQKPTPQPQYTPTTYDNQEPQYDTQPYNSERDYYEASQEYRPRTRPPSSYTKPQNQQIYDPRYTRTFQANEAYDTDDYQRRG